MNESVQWFLQNVVGWIGVILIASVFLMALLMAIGFFVNLVCDWLPKKPKTFSDEVIRIAHLEHEPCPLCGSHPRIDLLVRKASGLDWMVQYHVSCPDCGLFVFAKGPDKAVKIWNKAAIKKRGERLGDTDDAEIHIYTTQEATIDTTTERGERQ